MVNVKMHMMQKALNVSLYNKNDNTQNESIVPKYNLIF